MLNNKGSISILVIYYSMIMLLVSIIINSLYLEASYFYQNIKDRNLFYEESLIVKKVYDDYKNINFKNKQLQISGNYLIKDNDVHLKVELIVNNKKYYYDVVYDYICKRVISLNKYDFN